MAAAVREEEAEANPQERHRAMQASHRAAVVAKGPRSRAATLLACHRVEVVE